MLNPQQTEALRERLVKKFTDQWFASTQGRNDRRIEIFHSFIEAELSQALERERERIEKIMIDERQFAHAKDQFVWTKAIEIINSHLLSPTKTNKE